MDLINMNDYKKQIKENKDSLEAKKKIFQILDIDIENNTVLYLDIEDTDIIIFDMFDDLFDEKKQLIDNKKYITYNISNKYNNISFIFSQTLQKSDEYIEKAQFTEEYLKDTIIGCEFSYYI